MRVAVISDIHANIPAIEAVLRDIHRRSVDSVICLGDLIGKGPSSKEAIDICRRECDIIVQGNWDEFLYRKYKLLQQGDGDGVSDNMRWYIDSAGDERMEYLGSLPHTTELFVGGKLVRLFHAHPQNFNRYYEQSPLEQRLELFDCYDLPSQRKADVAIYGDIHGAYLQVLDDVGILLNTGSVGNPLDLPQASYVILEGDGTDFSTQFLRVSYDIERSVLDAVDANSPDLEGYIQELRTAVYFRRAP